MVTKNQIGKLIVGFLVFTTLFSSEKINKSSQLSNTLVQDGTEYVIRQFDNNNQTREDITLWSEDFEGDISGWNADSGWNLTTDDSNSPTHSMVSPNDASTYDNTWDLISPTISLPELGDGETMNFSFFLKGDTPDTDGDGDGYLEDYYSVSILDLDAIAWGPSSTNSYDGNSYWCGDEEVGGYLDSWIQYMDTPSFIVPNGE